MFRYAITTFTFLLLLSDVSAGEKGKPKFTNRLAKETSPYLLMHAHNPTNWYPWGPEAFEKAKKENKLVFLSIGYSSCYWCHVMERESFNNEEVAKILNDDFVCIKVDREERPDIDQIYMTALNVQRPTAAGRCRCSSCPTAGPSSAAPTGRAEDKKIDGETITGFKTILKNDPRRLQGQTPSSSRSRPTRSPPRTTRALEGAAVPGIALVDAGSQAASTRSSRSSRRNSTPSTAASAGPIASFRGTKFPMPPRLLLLAASRRTRRRTKKLLAHGRR